jgi:adenylate kinase family enzyme
VTGRRVHVVGAAGSGTTTLGAALARDLGCPHLDTDDYFWLPTEPRFEQPREASARRALLGADLARHPAWVLSGSLCGWGDPFIPLFDLVVFLAVPTEIRVARLRGRERQRYGEGDIAPGGRLHAKYEAFIAWAASYELGPATERSRQRHEAWLATLPCPVLRLEDTDDVPTRLARVRGFRMPDR